MSASEIEEFHRLPEMQAEEFTRWGSEKSLWLLTKTYTEDGGTPLLYKIEYKHRELLYRTPDSKHPVAFGQAREEHSERFQEVRIIFSPSRGTASMRGLGWLDGEIKMAHLP